MVARLVERHGGGFVSVVRASVEVDATPEEVWAVVADPRNLPRWSKFVASVDGVPDGGLEKGSEYTTVMRFTALRARVLSTVVEWDPPMHSTVRLSGLLHATVKTEIGPLPGGRSRMEHEVEYRFRGGRLGQLAARSVRLVGGAQLALRHGTLAQKRQVEGR